MQYKIYEGVFDAFDIESTKNSCRHPSQDVNSANFYHTTINKLNTNITCMY